MVYLYLWASSKILFLKFPCLGTQILFLWNLQIPSAPCSNSIILPFIPSASFLIAVSWIFFSCSIKSNCRFNLRARTRFCF
ncbi:hypothetical protein HanRHA438_Chr05g0228931 [Helianthus annuus]|nr:hypothetical protein HanRHA438_Chr05g0228931 [Helianthus annuus]